MYVDNNTSLRFSNTPSSYYRKARLSVSNVRNNNHHNQRHKFIAPVVDTDQNNITYSNNNDNVIATQTNQQSEQQLVTVNTNNQFVQLYDTQQAITIDDKYIDYIENKNNIIHSVQQSKFDVLYHQQFIENNVQFIDTIDNKLEQITDLIQQLQNTYISKNNIQQNKNNDMIIDIISLEQHDIQSNDTLNTILKSIDDVHRKHNEDIKHCIQQAKRQQEIDNKLIDDNVEKQRREQQQAEQAEKQRIAHEQEQKDKQKQADELKQQQQSQQNVIHNNDIDNQQQSSQTSCIQQHTTNPAIAYTDKCINIMHEYKQQSLQYNNSDKLQLRATITRTINQLSGTITQVKNKTMLLADLVKQSKQQNDNVRFSYIIHEISSRLVGQGRSRIARHTATAFSVALVATQLSLLDNNFMYVFLGCLYDSCIYTIPKFITSKQYSNKDEYMKALGYETLDNDDDAGIINNNAIQYETEEHYYDRVGGYVSLYGAYCQVPAPNHPHGISYAWSYISRICNHKVIGITSLLLYNFLYCSFYTMYRTYPKQQIKKLLYFIQSGIIPKLLYNTETRKACNQRLINWLNNTLEQIENDADIEQPEGRSLPTDQESNTQEQVINDEDRNAE